MEVKLAFILGLKHVAHQISIRPRLKFTSAAVLSLFMVLAIASQASNLLDSKKDEIKVAGHAVLVANTGGDIVESEITANIDSKLSPFAYVSPVDDGLITQKYASYHRAVDIATSFGSRVRPIGTGVVTYAGFSADGKGNIVVVDHGDGLTTSYAHIGTIEAGVGNKVDPSSTLGTVGLTGRTTGPHVHLEVFDGDVAMDPISLLP